jgi:hypothetical protein
MTKLSTIAISLALVLGAGCKKEEKKDEGAGKATAAEKKDPKADPKAGEPKADPKAGEPKPADPTATPPAAGDGSKFAWKPQPVGKIEETVDHLDSKFTITGPDGKPIEMVQTRDLVFHFEVVEAGDTVTKAKVHYEKATEKREMMGKAQEQALPVQGKAYLMWVESGTFKATTADGKDVTPDELEVLQDKHADGVGKIPAMPRVIAARTWKQGEKVALEAAELALLNESEDMEAKAANVTLVSADATTARFEVELEGVKKDDEGEMTIKMKMEAAIDPTSLQSLEIKMAGTIEGKVQGMAMSGTLGGVKTSTLK